MKSLPGSDGTPLLCTLEMTSSLSRTRRFDVGTIANGMTRLDGRVAFDLYIALRDSYAC